MPAAVQSLLGLLCCAATHIYLAEAELSSPALGGPWSTAPNSSGWSWDDLGLGGYFELVKFMGRGDIGQVFLVNATRDFGELKNGATYAVKAFRTPPKAQERFDYYGPLNVFLDEDEDVHKLREAAHRECEIARKLHAKGHGHKWQHYFVHCVHDGIQRRTNEGIAPEDIHPDFLVYEDARSRPAGIQGVDKQVLDWWEFVQRESNTVQIVEVLISIMQQLLQALAFLQDVGYIHHDIHMDNVVLSIFQSRTTNAWEPVLKIVDYTDMIEATPETVNASMATFWSFPPESRTGAFSLDYPYGFDLYMMGTVFVELLTGEGWRDSVPHALPALRDGSLVRDGPFAVRLAELVKAFEKKPTLMGGSNLRLLFTKARCWDGAAPSRALPERDIRAVVEARAAARAPELEDMAQLSEARQLLCGRGQEGLSGEEALRCEELRDQAEIDRPVVRRGAALRKVWEALAADERNESFLQIVLRDAISKMLAYDPKVRGTAKDLLEPGAGGGPGAGSGAGAGLAERLRAAVERLEL